jgi:hypothetical protein
MSKKQAAAILRTVITHLVDYGKIELGTPQSKALISAAKVLGAFPKEQP